MQDDRIASLLHDIETILNDMRSEVVEHAGSLRVNYKDDGSEQTVMDVHVEDKIFEYVAPRYPDITFYGEESGYELPLPDYCCLLDPIDGTKSYIEGVDGYTAMAVVIVNNKALGSLIYRYTDGDSFIAIQGRGATKNGEVLSLENVKLPDTIYCRERMIPHVRKLPELSSLKIDKGPTGAGYGFSLVAEGSIAARINAPHSVGSGAHIHDYAPGTLLVQESGGSIVPFNTSEYKIDSFSFVACHPALKETMQSLSSEFMRIESESLQ